jgi:hypothetical protein
MPKFGQHLSKTQSDLQKKTQSATTLKNEAILILIFDILFISYFTKRDWVQMLPTALVKKKKKTSLGSANMLCIPV